MKCPNAKGRLVCELTDAIEVSFEKVQYADERGNEHVRVDSMTVYQAGMTIAMPRAVPPADLPTTDEVLALVRRASPPNALAGAKTLQVKGAMRMPNQGLDGTLEFSAAGLDRIAQRVDFGRFGAMRSVLSDGRAWIDLPMQGHRILDAGETDELRRQHPMRELDDWTARYESIRVIGRRKLGDVDTIAVRVRAPGGMSSTKYVDTTTGDVVREEGSVLVAGLMALPFTTVNSDFRDVAGARIPFRVVGENDATGRSEVVRAERADRRGALRGAMTKGAPGSTPATSTHIRTRDESPTRAAIGRDDARAANPDVVHVPDIGGRLAAHRRVHARARPGEFPGRSSGS
jgi:hypothetical protein